MIAFLAMAGIAIAVSAAVVVVLVVVSWIKEESDDFFEV